MWRPPIAPDSLDIIVPLAVLAAAAWVLSPPLGIMPVAALLCSLWFFRDPERRSGGAEGDVVSPADGTVEWVREVNEPRFLGGRALGLSIYLSLFDVRVNRAPVSGEVAYREYVPGRFVPAARAGVEDVDERACTGLTAGPHRILVLQIAGRVARRIITSVEVGDRLVRGQRIGMIRGGSRTQVLLPPDSTPLVTAGQRVRAGVTPLARLPG